jgi:hypothetical protein
MKYLSRCFAVDIAGYAVMSNHLHLVVRMRVGDPATWTPDEVARRWLSVYPRQYLSDGTPVLPSDAVIAQHAHDWAWVALRRKRLADLGWFMKALKENIARRANSEDRCTGAFWEGRFASVPLLDQPALIACMAYVDLNPIRAKLSETPEDSAYTSVGRRIRARNRFHAATRLREREPERAQRLLERAGLARGAAHPEDGLWLTPLSRCMVGEVLANKRVTVDDYVTLVDATGRAVKASKRGSIPAELAPILARLDITVEAWIATMLSPRQMIGRAIGTRSSRMAEAARRGLRWVKNSCALFAAEAAA